MRPSGEGKEPAPRENRRRPGNAAACERGLVGLRRRGGTTAATTGSGPSARPPGWSCPPRRRLPAPSGSAGPGRDGRRTAAGSRDALPALCRRPELVVEAWRGFSPRREAAPSGYRGCVGTQTSSARTEKTHPAAPAGAPARPQLPAPACPPGSSIEKTIRRPTHCPRELPSFKPTRPVETSNCLAARSGQHSETALARENRFGVPQAPPTAPHPHRNPGS